MNSKAPYSAANDAARLPTVKQPQGSNPFACMLDEEGHCITCSDEALSVKVLLVDRETEMARVEVQGKEEEVDITLIENVRPGDILLVHGGVAIACTEGNGDE